MMEWALVFLFGAAALLLVLSFYQMKRTSIEEQRQIDTIYYSLNEEILKLQKQVRELELDKEIMEQKDDSQPISFEERALLREMLDLYKRGYTIDGIAAKKELKSQEVKELLTPYIFSKNERRAAANES
jgi:hypothetical protein